MMKIWSKKKKMIGQMERLQKRILCQYPWRLFPFSLVSHNFPLGDYIINMSAMLLIKWILEFYNEIKK